MNGLPVIKIDNDSLDAVYLGYDQFGISRKGSQDTSDEYCTIFYEKEKVWFPLFISFQAWDILEFIFYLSHILLIIWKRWNL